MRGHRTRLLPITCALVALGYTQAEAAAAVRRVLDEQGGREGVDLIRAALASLAARK